MSVAWIPNTLTLGNLVLGFISIIFASTTFPHSLTISGILILAAALLDGLDGQVARMLGVASELGKELDSLADCVTFGVAPGFLAYQGYLSGTFITIMGTSIDAGIFIAAIFPVCAAYRLARFNVIHVPNAFDGLPSPIAGIIVALVPLCFLNIHIPKIVFIISFVIVALLMVSTVRYTKPQSYLLEKITGIKLFLFIIVFVGLIVIFKQWVILAIIALYILSGILSFIIQLIQDYRY
ncbi:MAG: CDP-diacylglycerol--serine O-phosphatidyltransferase [Spirochaetes bacterium]|nr:CDP-diacylglycerol--serine O-phosphatidyltransferase [Spirochaetota bacterium]